MKTTDKAQIGTSTTTTTGGYYTIPPYYQSEKGWECPRCGRINAPWVRQCDCSSSPSWNKITVDSDKITINPNDEWWKTKITCNDTKGKEWWKTSIDTFMIHPEEMATWTSVNDLKVGGSDYKDPVTGDWVNVATTYTNSVKR